MKSIIIAAVALAAVQVLSASSLLAQSESEAPRANALSRSGKNGNGTGDLIAEIIERYKSACPYPPCKFDEFDLYTELFEKEGRPFKLSEFGTEKEVLFYSSTTRILSRSFKAPEKGKPLEMYDSEYVGSGAIVYFDFREGLISRAWFSAQNPWLSSCSGKTRQIPCKLKFIRQYSVAVIDQDGETRMPAPRYSDGFRATVRMVRNYLMVQFEKGWEDAWYPTAYYMVDFEKDKVDLSKIPSKP